MGAAAESLMHVLVLDDHEIVRLGVRQLLEDRAQVHEAADLAQALTLLRRQPCALALVDLSLGEDFGLTALPRLRDACPGIRLLVLSSMAEDLWAERALQAGADGFVSKGELVGSLREAIDAVLAGQVHLSPAQRSALLRRATGSPAARSLGPSLTPKETEVLRLIATGLGTREIAERLHRSVKTIETHKQSLKDKLAADSPTQLVRKAVAWLEAQE